MTFCKIILWLLIIPYILGKYLEEKKKSTFLYSWILGYVIEMGICILLAIPLILTRNEFKVLYQAYNIVICTLTAFSLVINRKKLIPKFDKKMKISFFQCIAILLVFSQMFIKFRYTNINNDDSSFVVLGTKQIESGYMYHNGPETPLNGRRALAPLASFFAILSQNLGIHLTIVMHTIWPIVFMAIGGIIFYYFGKTLFKDNEDSPYIFTIFMFLLYTYFFTRKGAGLYYLKFTWFGRALVGAVFLPLLWKTILDIITEKDTLRSWITALMIVLASCLCSEMAIALVSISLMAISFVSSIRGKKISYMLKSIVCLAPCIALGVVYLMIDKF